MNKTYYYLSLQIIFLQWKIKIMFHYNRRCVGLQEFLTIMGKEYCIQFAVYNILHFSAKNAPDQTGAGESVIN